MPKPKTLTTITLLILLTGCTSTTTETTTDTATTTITPTPQRNHLKAFQTCVAKTGTNQQKTAITHITKLTDMDNWKGVLDNPKAWTNWTGGIQHAADANLITTAFANCYTSNNGLITVYTQDGHVAGTAKF